MANNKKVKNPSNEEAKGAWDKVWDYIDEHAPNDKLKFLDTIEDVVSKSFKVAKFIIPNKYDMVSGTKMVMEKIGEIFEKKFGQLMDESEKKQAEKGIKVTVKDNLDQDQDKNKNMKDNLGKNTEVKEENKVDNNINVSGKEKEGTQVNLQ
jgi:hypothetical protein